MYWFCRAFLYSCGVWFGAFRSCLFRLRGLTFFWGGAAFFLPVVGCGMAFYSHIQLILYHVYYHYFACTFALHMRAVLFLFSVRFGSPSLYYTPNPVHYQQAVLLLRVLPFYLHIPFGLCILFLFVCRTYR